MKQFKQSFKSLLATMVLLCVSMSVFALPPSEYEDGVNIDGVFYSLRNGWNYNYYDYDNGYSVYSDWYDRAAIVTYDSSIDIWSTDNNETYKGSIVIPDKVTKDGIEYPVLAVGEYAFRNCKKLTSVQLPSSVVYMGYSAFENCTSLTSITMPGIEVINSGVFNYSGLTSINLPKSFKCIINGTGGSFNNMNSLTSITVDDDNAFYKSVDGVLYDKNITKIIGFPVKKGGTYTIPASITVLKSSTFPCGLTLDELVIPATVTKIEDNTFCEPRVKKLTIEDTNNELYFGKGSYSAEGITDETGSWRSIYTVFNTLEELYLGRNLKCPDYSSPFAGSYNLNKVSIGSYVTSMIKYAFRGCYIIDYVNYDGTITDWCNILFEGPDATPFGKSMVKPEDYTGSAILYLKGSPLHSQVNIPSGATKIGAYAFYGMDGVSSVIVPSTVTTIEPYAFNCGSITTVYLNTNSVIGLADVNSFSSETAIILNDYTVMAAYKNDPVWVLLKDNLHTEAFLTTTVDLTAMTNSPALLPALNALEKVNDEYRIAGLTNLKIRGTMNGWDILMIRTKMPKLHTLDLSEAIILDNDGGQEYYTGYHTTANTISPYSFYKLQNLRKVMLPQDITSIGEYAFAECTNLQEVLYIPETCTEIRSNAFRQSGLTSIEINKGVKTIGSGAFESCYRLRDVTFVKGLETIGGGAFQYCSNLKKLVFPTTLKRIEGNAFYGCNSLNDIDFAEGLTDIGYSAFYNCGIRDLHLPTSLRYIEGDAFRYCYGLSQVHLPSKLKQIGDNAFKNCGLKSVYAYTLIPVQINQNTFDYAGVDLFAPDNSFYTYYMNTQWAQFPNVYEFPALYTDWYTGRDTDIEIDVKVPIKSANTDIPADGEMEPGSGMVFVGDGEQLVKKLIMNWGHGDNYPSLIENNNLSVDELAFIMNVYPGRWYFFCFPFDVKLKNIKHDGKWVWRYYDAEERAKKGSGGWKNLETDVLKANVGYIFQCNTGGDLELPVENPDFFSKNGARTRGGASNLDKNVNLLSYESSNPQNASWNFVGNPNLSYYSLDDMAADFNAPITIWDPDQQTYTAVVPGDDEYDIHPFQAFFIQKPTDSEEVTFKADNRATYNQAQKKAAARHRARATRAVDENHMIINVEISDGKTTDKTRVVFDDNKSFDYEIGFDANKMMSMAEVPQVYTLDNKNVKYAVNNRPNKGNEVRLGFSVPADGNYTISAPHMDIRMALKDKATGTIHDFSNGEYTFQAKAGSDDNRFALVLANGTTGISEDGIEGLDIAAENGGISVNGITDKPVYVYNVKGIRVATLIESGNVNLANGTYIVSTGNKNTKILVK